MGHSCPTCGDSFDTDHGVKVHHKLSHGESLAKRECECNNCGTIFMEFQSRIERGKGRYCSTECEHEIGRVKLSCRQCGDSFSRPKHRAKRSENDFCSVDCQIEYRQEGGKNAVGWQGGAKITKPCDNCGSGVTRDKSQFFGEVYCSIGCMSKSREREGNPNWSGGSVSWYGKNWPEQRKMAIKRDGLECQSCGLTQEDHLDEYGRDLSVHHIRPIQEFKRGGELNYEEANKLSNLITMCINCHQNHDTVTLQPEVIV